MVTYYLRYVKLVRGKKSGSYDLIYGKKPFAKAESIKVARVRAMTYLARHGKTGGRVDIGTANKFVEMVHMDLNSINDGFWDESTETVYGAPSVGLKKGYRFLSSMDYVDKNWRDSRIILKDGSLGKKPNW